VAGADNSRDTILNKNSSVSAHTTPVNAIAISLREPLRSATEITNNPTARGNREQKRTPIVIGSQPMMHYLIVGQESSDPCRDFRMELGWIIDRTRSGSIIT
jgi:hypothetical protein